MPTSPGAALAPRVVVTVIAGGALAAAGQMALSHALPLAAGGTNVLRLSVQEFIGSSTPPDAAPLADLAPAVGPVDVVPRPIDVGDLVKAAERHRRATAAAQAAQLARAAQEARAAADAARAAKPPIGAKRAPVDAGPDGAVQMINGRVTSGFGVRWGRAHKGLDIAAPIGTPIRVPLAGEVVASGPASGFGLWVRVRHDDGTVTTYGHVNRALVGVGEHVDAGEEIAEVGNRGQSTGPHLHVEVETPGGATVNPRPWLDDHRIGY